MNIQELEKAVNSLERDISLKNQQLGVFNRELRRQKSLEWIRINEVKLEDIELPDGDDKPYFGHISSFIEWLNENSQKRFAVWNEKIYFQVDLKDGRMPQHAPGCIDDIISI